MQGMYTALIFFVVPGLHGLDFGLDVLFEGGGGKDPGAGAPAEDPEADFSGAGDGGLEVEGAVGVLGEDLGFVPFLFFDVAGHFGGKPDFDGGGRPLEYAEAVGHVLAGGEVFGPVEQGAGEVAGFDAVQGKDADLAALMAVADDVEAAVVTLNAVWIDAAPGFLVAAHGVVGDLQGAGFGDGGVKGCETFGEVRAGLFVRPGFYIQVVLHFIDELNEIGRQQCFYFFEKCVQVFVEKGMLGALEYVARDVEGHGFAKGHGQGRVLPAAVEERPAAVFAIAVGVVEREPHFLKGGEVPVDGAAAAVFFTGQFCGGKAVAA